MAASSGEERPAVRRRKQEGNLPKTDPYDGSESREDNDDIADTHEIGPNTYWLTRIVLLRSLAFVYCKFNE